MTKTLSEQDQARLNLASALEATVTYGGGNAVDLAVLTRANLPLILAALRAEPARGEEEMRERCLQAVHGAFVPMSASASDAFTERGIGLAIAAIRALPASHEGGGE